MTTLGILLYAIGALVSAMAGLLTVENRFYSFGLLALGLMCMAAACWLSGVWRPSTAVSLLLVTNATFWLSFAMWRIRPRLIGPTADAGLDPFSLAVSVWLIVFAACLIYEGFVLIRGVSDGTHRRVAVVGLIGAVLQVPTTMRVIFTMLQGV